MIHNSVSFIDKLKLHLYLVKISFKKRIRDIDTINNEYELGIWNKSYVDINFETRSGMYGRTDQDKNSIFVLDDVMFKGKLQDWEQQFDQQFLDVLDNYVDDQIIEFGCGLGFNLFTLKNAGFKKLEGYDLSQNAILLAKKHSTEKKYDISFDVCDITKPFLNQSISNKTIFTFACLEQLKHFIPNVLKNIIDGKPKIVINFELDYDSSPYIVKKYYDVCDYQNNLVIELQKLEKQEQIEIISINKFPLSLSPIHRFSAIIWKIKE